MTEPTRASPTVVHPSGLRPQGLVDEVVAQRGGRVHMYDSLDGPRTAFVVVDLDERSCERAGTDHRLYGPVNAVAAAVRESGGTVAFVTTSIPSPYWAALSLGPELAAEQYAAVRSGAATRLAAEIDVGPADLRTVKARTSASDTITDIGCESTARDAYELGYEVTMVSDALVRDAWGLHEASLASLYGVFGDVRPSREVIELLRGP
jgi:nicotinamidase-related amidase